MINIIVGVAVLALVALAIFSLIRNRKNGGCSCCSGCGSSCGCASSAEKEDDGKVFPAGSSLHIDIAGMHCEKCSTSVTEALNKLDGVTAEVSLQNNSASAKLSKSISSRAIKEAVGDRGFEVTHIREA